MKSDRVSLREARELTRAVLAFCRDVEPNIVVPSEAPALWRTLDEAERALAGAKTLLAGRVEESGDWERSGARSAAEHLARLGGTTTSQARDALNTSRSVERLPDTKDALRAGRLSTAQAAAIADAAAADPDSEQRLLELAGATNLHDLREECGRTKAAADRDRDATYQRIRAQRRVMTHPDSEGAWNLNARGPADHGAVFESELERLIDEEFTRSRQLGRREPREAYAFDALMRVAERSACGGLDGGGTDDKRRRSNPRFLAMLQVSVEALCRGEVQGEERCEIPGAGPIPMRRAREILGGDNIVKLVITKGPRCREHRAPRPRPERGANGRTHVGPAEVLQQGLFRNVHLGRPPHRVQKDQAHGSA